MTSSGVHVFISWGTFFVGEWADSQWAVFLALLEAETDEEH